MWWCREVWGEGRALVRTVEPAEGAGSTCHGSAVAGELAGSTAHRRSPGTAHTHRCTAGGTDSSPAGCCSVVGVHCCSLLIHRLSLMLLLPRIENTCKLGTREIMHTFDDYCFMINIRKFDDVYV